MKTKVCNNIDDNKRIKVALVYGISSSFFFAFTFVLNRSMNLSGGYWLWGACLRYLFMLPMLWIPLIKNKRWKMVLTYIRKEPGKWILWSTIGFGLFYTPLCFASVYGESWFIAACWQITIVCGMLLTPLFGKPLPRENLLYGIIILAGVFLMLWRPDAFNLKNTFLSIIPLIIAAFAYPLGNRKMMIIVKNELSTLERVFGMTLCSMPFWIVCTMVAFGKSGKPSNGQLIQSVLVALSSGVLATVLFFKATDFIKDNHRQLALIEATQCGEVLFTLIGGILISGDPLPSVLSFIGIGIILFGMVMESFCSS